MSTITRSLAGAVAAVAATAVVLTGCSIPTAEQSAPTTNSVTEPTTTTAQRAETKTATSKQFAAAVAIAPPADAALAHLATLDIKGRAPKTGYDRALFGQAWSDDVTVEGGHNGCDTRNDILRRDLTDVTVKPGTNGCVVATGTLHDPYSGKVVDFERGGSTSPLVQIDHVVALSDAWQKGAQQLDAQTRQNFANDPRNLQATDGPINQQKGDGDAATWLPPNKPYRCTYVARQVEVKAAYGLWVTQAEHDAIARILTDCGAAPTPTTTVSPADDDSSRTAPAAAEPEYTPAPTVHAPAYTPPPATVQAPAPASAYYANCAAVRAAGAAPLYAGQPGYSGKLDGDKDGVACE